LNKKSRNTSQSMDSRLEIDSSESPFSLRGFDWPTLQHYVQAQKFHGSKFEELVRLAPTAAEAVQIAEENKSNVRPNWEKIYPEILFEGTLSKIDQHPQLRELLISTEIICGECAASLLKAQSIFRRLEPHECVIFDLYEDEAALRRDMIAQEIAEKKEKARTRRNVWKDQSGGSLLEMDSSNSVSLVGNSQLSFPMSALPNNAKFVVKKYQYEKRYLNDNSEEENDDDYDNDEYEEFEAPRKGGKLSLGDFIGESELIEKSFSVPDFLQSSTSILTELQNSRLNGSNLEELVQHCQSNQQRALDLIEKGHISEDHMAQLLQLLDSLNSVLF
jgi:hypothetical protein